MYLLYYSEIDLYAQQNCINCWLSTHNTGSDDFTLPLCYATPVISNLSARVMQQLAANINIHSSITVAFQEIWHALQYLSTIQTLSLDCIVLQEVDKQDYVVNECSEIWHVYCRDPENMKQLRTWNLDTEAMDIWQYAMSHGEDWQYLDTRILLHIVIQFGNIRLYQVLTQAGFSLLTPENQDWFVEKFANIPYSYDENRILAFDAEGLSFIVTLMLTRYISAHNWTEIQTLLSKLDLSTIKPYSEIITRYFLTHGINFIEVLLQLYDIGLFQITERVFREHNTRILKLVDMTYVVSYISMHQTSIVKWLLEIGVDYKWLQDTYLLGWNNNNTEIPRLLHANMSSQHQHLALYIAMSMDHSHDLEWLLEANSDLLDQVLQYILHDNPGYACMEYLQKRWNFTFQPQEIIMAEIRRGHDSIINLLPDIVHNDEALFLMAITRPRFIMQHLNSETMSNIYFDIRMSKTQLQFIMRHSRRNVTQILDLAPDLDDVSFLEFLLLYATRSIFTAENVFDKVYQSGQDVDTSRWSNYFLPGSQSTYTCRHSHSRCYTLNLWADYAHYHDTAGIKYVWQRQWLHSDTMQILAPYMQD